MITRYLISICLFSLMSCGRGNDNSTYQNTQISSCGPFGSSTSSDYRLPYSVGTAFFLNQSNCSGFGHSWFWTYVYDFTMDIGTQVVAMRDSTVVHTQDGTVDGNTGNTGGLPHLHVSLHPCIGLPGLTGNPNTNCPTQPFNFNNIQSGLNNLIARRNYLAI